MALYTISDLRKIDRMIQIAIANDTPRLELIKLRMKIHLYLEEKGEI